MSFLKNFGLLIFIVLVVLTGLYFINPLLPEKYSFGETRPPETPDNGNLTLTYDVPTAAEIDVATNFEASIPDVEKVPDTFNIPLPLSEVSPEYIAAFNGLLNQSAVMEKQMKDVVAPLMLTVQKQAATGNFITMFDTMKQAQEQLVVLNKIAGDFNEKISLYRQTYTEPGMKVSVRTSSQALDDAAVELYKETLTFSKLLEQSVNGTVPDQSLVSAVEASNKKLEADAQIFVDAIAQITEVVKVPN